MKCSILEPPHPDRLRAHAGSPCADPECLFRRPVVRESFVTETPFADHLKQKVRELRIDLGLDPPPLDEAPHAPPPPHFCHVPECPAEVRRSYLMCIEHWRRVPRALRARVLATYQAGQELGKVEPSPEYVEAARAAIDAVRQKEAPALDLTPPPQLTLF